MTVAAYIHNGKQGRPIRNLYGGRFGHLVVQGLAPREEWRTEAAEWVARCDCGNIVNKRQDKLVQGRTTSCGCGGGKA